MAPRQGKRSMFPRPCRGSSQRGSMPWSREEKGVLQAAAVVGKVFWLGSVAAIADISLWDAEERLHALERKEFVRRDRRASVGGETEYAVRHVLVRDVALGQIPRVRRADLHLRAARLDGVYARTRSCRGSRGNACTSLKRGARADSGSRRRDGDGRSRSRRVARSARPESGRTLSAPWNQQERLYSVLSSCGPRVIPTTLRCSSSSGRRCSGVRNAGESELRGGRPVFSCCRRSRERGLWPRCSPEASTGSRAIRRARGRTMSFETSSSSRTCPETRRTVWIRSWVWRGEGAFGRARATRGRANGSWR